MRITKNVLTKELKNILGNDVEIIFNEVTKTNVKKKGVTIKSPDSNISPTFYLDQFENYSSHKEIANEIARMYEKNKLERPNIDLSFIEDFENVKPRIREKLVNTKMNKDLLSKVPSVEFLDLSKVFYIGGIQLNNGAVGTITVTNALCDKWGITVYELEAISRENTILEGYKLLSISELIPIPEEAAESLPMYVLTNSEDSFGACLISYTEILGKIAKAKDLEELIIIPSSLNEVILTPMDERLSEITEMIMTVNSNELDPTEVLSDHPYIYDLKTNKVRCAQ